MAPFASIPDAVANSVKINPKIEKRKRLRWIEQTEDIFLSLRDKKMELLARTRVSL